MFLLSADNPPPAVPQAPEDSEPIRLPTARPDAPILYEAGRCAAKLQDTMVPHTRRARGRILGTRTVLQGRGKGEREAEGIGRGFRCRARPASRQEAVADTARRPLVGSPCLKF